MPIAIVISKTDVIPAVLAEATAEALVAALRGVKEAPDLPDAASARRWLQSLPEPSGWFEDAAEAKAHLARMKEEAAMTAEDVRAAREALGLTRVAFGEAIGMKGNENTRQKHIHDVETGKKQLGPIPTRRLRALLAEAAVVSE